MKQSGSIFVDIGSWFIREIPNGTVGEKLLIGLAAGKYVDAICTAEGRSRFLAVVFVVYWLYLAVHAVDIDMARLLTPVRYGGIPNPWTPQLTQKEALMYTLHVENDGNTDEGNRSMDVEKMKQATGVLLKKRHPHIPEPTPEGDVWGRHPTKAQSALQNPRQYRQRPGRDGRVG